MALDANSYGTVAKVGGLTPRYANAVGTYDAATNPTSTAVEGMIDRVSSMTNGCLASLGFSIPVTQEDAYRIMENIVVETVAQMIEGVRGSGRYSPNAKAVAGRGMFAVISEDICNYLTSIAPALEAWGVGRTSRRGIGSTSAIRKDGYSDDITGTEADTVLNSEYAP